MKPRMDGGQVDAGELSDEGVDSAHRCGDGWCLCLHGDSFLGSLPLLGEGAYCLRRLMYLRVILDYA